MERGKDRPDLLIQEEVKFGAKKQTGDQQRPLCGLARNGRDTEVKKKTNQRQIFY